MLKLLNSKIQNLRLAFLLLVLFLAGCAGPLKHMREVPPEDASYVPQEGKALIVFMRPSSLGFAIQSSVFEIVDDVPKLVGIVAAKKKVAYNLEPGEHIFMVVSENADFMTADVQEGKTYYALVTPRMGLWKARFSLKPIHKDKLKSAEFTNLVDSCRWVETISESKQWVQDNMASIQSKQMNYMKKWQQTPIANRQALHAEDGL